MAWVEVPMYFVSTMMPVTLMAIGVAYGIHILSRYYDEILSQPEPDAHAAVLAAMGEMWKPVVFTALTTAAGFLSFLTAAMVPIRYFGLFTSVGVLAAMVVSLTFFPAVLSLLSPRAGRGLRRQMKRGRRPRRHRLGRADPVQSGPGGRSTPVAGVEHSGWQYARLPARPPAPVR